MAKRGGRPARALILEAPFTGAVNVGQERYPYIPVNWLMRDKFLNSRRIRDVHMPLLIAHGTRDTVVPYAHGLKLYDMANPPKTFVRMLGSDHSTLPRDGVIRATGVSWPALRKGGRRGLPRARLQPAEPVTGAYCVRDCALPRSMPSTIALRDAMSTPLPSASTDRRPLSTIEYLPDLLWVSNDSSVMRLPSVVTLS